ncbi:MAG: TldD/PmbA family protein [Actinobacteria bacterium]|jgi:PmbA protein|nr:TldD/PmbA family protein [Actinomycetota bacterium]MBT3745925.1 TldD/PmbA family protein [Actinomycetota bacterium]MBT3969209.1 TldD/PmbA family protein [Actinomycetota bacterium]MBT4009796.1 TldD/PmbA family protein [Actinomycetota bacterium]MBT4302451.1 TldD/PmbA family protein [Actinomycetota bacterium]
MSDLLSLCDRLVAQAQPGEQVEVVAVHERETEVRAYEGQVESLTAAESQGVGVRVIRDGRQGFASAGTLDLAILDETLAEARENLAFATPDEFCALATPDALDPAVLDIYRQELVDFPVESKVALALELERRTRQGDPRIIGVESADYSDSVTQTAVATTTGIRTTAAETGCFLSAYSLAEENGDTQAGFGFSVGRQPSDLEVSQAATDAVERSTRMLGAVKPPSGRMMVVLDPWVSAQFLGIVGGTLSGEAVQKGRSLFAERLGDQVAAASLTLIDDPTNPAAFTATATDGEGLATRRNVLMQDGRLEKFVHNSYTARRAGTASTGSAVRGYSSTPGVGVQAVSVQPGQLSPDALIAGITDGLLVQGVSGLHSGVNPVSGDFSTGAEGLRIRNGELAEPVREFTIASTLQKMLLEVTAVGDDLVWLPMKAAGVTLVIAELTVSGA